MYLSWAAFYEGGSDRAYFDSLVPRILEDIILSHGIRLVNIPAFPALYLGSNGREVEAVSREICANKDAFYLIFVHADIGGRGIAATLGNRSVSYCNAAHQLCQWDQQRCVTITPKHETEAWALADPVAVAGALGYSGKPQALGLPSTATEAESLNDPKAVLQMAANEVLGRRAKRGFGQLFTTIAQTQSIDMLRGSRSFSDFETRLKQGLRSLGCI